MSLTMRKADFNDVNEVYGMICDFEETEFDKNKFLDVFSRNLEESNLNYYIAEYDGKTAGFISLSMQYHLHHAARVAEIVEFYIKSEMRSAGLGRLIIAEVEKTAMENGCVVIELASNKKRERAHKFYERENYIPTHFKFVKNLTPN